MKTAQPVLDTSDPAGCCAPIGDGAMTAEDATVLAAKFKAIGDPNRLRLLSLVAAQSSGEACVCDLNETVDLSQPTVSHHLRILVEAGLLTRTKRGTWSYYALVPGALDALADTLRS
ncbi:transcriptional regulator [Aeromicrobium sp. A1-2]|uniref:ArsR/SmtB family transcription factor n=1 Tax=Aeromicrobium sp. A1-2 TaxID=2107713 RepID=UPI000E4C600F|nr:metalloregulator ArsR/SmtB family transcription factor [Aeromicrobium sp. A1-2]AXT86971.1 transcriptional regulator [Aeromicrobium sp. A1-2]